MPDNRVSRPFELAAFAVGVSVGVTVAFGVTGNVRVTDSVGVTVNVGVSDNVAVTVGRRVKAGVGVNDGIGRVIVIVAVKLGLVAGPTGERVGVAVASARGDGLNPYSPKLATHSTTQPQKARAARH
ncbi:MAG: hypothetical protein HY782_24715 [Chloroflexi bacterium]|nr:hypothetical protein [Chloroflexota bacterium]